MILVCLCSYLEILPSSPPATLLLVAKPLWTVLLHVAQPASKPLRSITLFCTCCLRVTPQGQHQNALTFAAACNAWLCQSHPFEVHHVSSPCLVACAPLATEGIQKVVCRIYWKILRKDSQDVVWITGEPSSFQVGAYCVL